MDSSDLTRQQVEQLMARIWPMLPYFKRLRERMEQRTFPKDDKLYRLVARTTTCTTFRCHCIT
jgi:hypothetical protein